MISTTTAKLQAPPDFFRRDASLNRQRQRRGVLAGTCGARDRDGIRTRRSAAYASTASAVPAAASDLQQTTAGEEAHEGVPERLSAVSGHQPYHAQ